MFRSYLSLIALLGLALAVGMGCSSSDGGGQAGSGGDGGAGTGGGGGDGGGGADGSLPLMEKDITIACNNSVQPQMSAIPGTLSVDPGVVVGGEPFTAELTGNLNFPEAFLDVAATVLPAGTSSTQIVDLAATVRVRSGTTGNDDVVLLVDPTIPTGCALTGDPCDVSENNPDYTNPACFDNPLDTCGAIVDLPLSTDPEVCADVDGVDKTMQLTNFGGCITGDLPLPLETKTANYTAEASGSSLLFGWIDDPGTADSSVNQCPDAENGECLSTNPGCTLGSLLSPVCAYDGPYADGTNNYISVPNPTYAAPIGPLGLKVNSVLLVAIECVMGAENDRPECTGLCEGGTNDGEPCPDGDRGCADGICGDPDAACGCSGADGCPNMLGATPDGDLIGYTIP